MQTRCLRAFERRRLYANVVFAAVAVASVVAAVVVVDPFEAKG